MKIAWFTPFNVESAIGRYSKLAAEALGQYAEVTIFTPSKKRLHDTKIKVVKFTRENVASLLCGYDLAVYNIGDNANYHSAIYEVFLRHPGVMIIHDICLHNFMRGYYLEYKKNVAEFKYRLKVEFGQTDAKRLWEVELNPEKYRELDFIKYSFSKHIADNAFGVVVHSCYHYDFIKEYFLGPKIVLPLLYMEHKEKKQDDDIKLDMYTTEKIHILTVGNLNENKQIHKIIQVLGENPELAEKFDYTVIGSMNNKHYCNRLRDQINSYGLNDIVNLLGYVDDKKLVFYYEGADVISNLRYPAYEGASASIVEQLAIGKICMVSNTGVYAELDDHCVIKIEPSKEIEEIQKKLELICRGDIDTKKIGENAREYAIKTFDQDLYARKLYEFLKEVVFQRPMHVVKDKIVSVIMEMPTVEEDFLKSIAATIDELY